VLAAYGEIDGETLAVFVAAGHFQGAVWSVLLDGGGDAGHGA
jgi:hypothetical protein